MHEVKLPQLGQSVEEASIVRWMKSEGDTVAKGEPLLAVQTDKAEIEVESPAAGVLRKVLLPTDVSIPVMTVIALIGEADEPLPDLSRYSASTPEKLADAPVVPTTTAPRTVSEIDETSRGRGVSPRARRKAAALGVNSALVSGTGASGRVTEADVEAYAESLPPATSTARKVAQRSGVDLVKVAGTGPRGRITKADVNNAKSAAPVLHSGQAREVPLTPMRRIIAERMTDSKFTAPHYYVTVEVDMSAAVALRKGLPWKPSYNDIVMRATALALVEFPAVNARWAETAILEVGEVNLGFAVALPTGLIVPVVRGAHAKSLQQISVECKALTEKAKTGKLLPDDYAGNTFTISNLGGFGVDHFTAIINQPDSAILAVGQIKDRPVVIDGGIHIRPIMKMTLSSDHRVIDGALAAQFMGRLREILELGRLD